jgi:hypothetical protein
MCATYKGYPRYLQRSFLQVPLFWYSVGYQHPKICSLTMLSGSSKISLSQSLSMSWCSRGSNPTRMRSPKTGSRSRGSSDDCSRYDVSFYLVGVRAENVTKQRVVQVSHIFTVLELTSTERMHNQGGRAGRRDRGLSSSVHVSRSVV